MRECWGFFFVRQLQKVRSDGLHCRINVVDWERKVNKRHTDDQR